VNFYTILAVFGLLAMPVTPSGFRTKKHWGQHFLADPGILDSLVRAFLPRPTDRVLEIGPGTGAFTQRLEAKVARLVAVEIDPALVEALRGPGAGAPPGFEVIEADILAIDPETLWRALRLEPGGRARVVGNLPYNIATAIILKLLPLRERVEDLMVMVQREVAERIVSPQHRKSYGSLSVLCQTLARVESIRRLRPGSFRPRPKVDSEVLRLTLRDPGGAAGRDTQGFAALVHACFAQRRKTLLNNLSRGDAFGAEARSLLERAAIDPGRRAEEIPPADFQRLFNVTARVVNVRDKG
jgi:16S rRNA (adenine1518-N6/adenine1519-N6)-dimethyltransferase